MESTAVLVLGNSKRSKLIEAVSGVGFGATLCRHTRDLLTGLRRGRFAAVLVDRDSAEADALEVVLNVRDVDPEVPIIVVGPRSDEQGDRLTETQPRTYLVGRDPQGHNLGERLAAIVTQRIA